jgi:hypothetical protein
MMTARVSSVAFTDALMRAPAIMIHSPILMMALVFSLQNVSPVALMSLLAIMIRVQRSKTSPAPTIVCLVALKRVPATMLMRPFTMTFHVIILASQKVVWMNWHVITMLIPPLTMALVYMMVV